MTDWMVISGKFLDLVKSRILEIRSDIPSEKIIDATRSDLGSSFKEYKDQPPNIQMNVLLAVLTRINEEHRLRIVDLIKGFGSVAKEFPSDDSSKPVDGFLDEQESFVRIVMERMVVVVDKNFVLKSLALGYLP